MYFVLIAIGQLTLRLADKLKKLSRLVSSRLQCLKKRRKLATTGRHNIKWKKLRLMHD